MKGILLAGGAGTRLYPLTLVTSKQLLPVYDKPMIYYPLSTLMLSGIQDIILISTPTDLPNFQRLLGNGSKFGIHLTYAEQSSPDGLAQALILAEDFLSGEPCALVLGDNLFYGSGLGERLRLAAALARQGKATVFGYRVQDPERYGVMEFEDDPAGGWRVLSLEEKPKVPKSSYCVTGLYFYDERACSFAHSVRPSARGELEITDVNRLYLQAGDLRAEILGRGYAWMDTGTMDSLLEASNFVHMIERRQDVQISAPEEIAWRNGWISRAQLDAAAKQYGTSPYGEHLRRVADGSLLY